MPTRNRHWTENCSLASVKTLRVEVISPHDNEVCGAARAGWEDVGIF